MPTAREDVVNSRIVFPSYCKNAVVRSGQIDQRSSIRSRKERSQEGRDAKQTNTKTMTEKGKVIFSGFRDAPWHRLVGTAWEMVSRGWIIINTTIR